MKLYNRKEVGEILKKAADSSSTDDSNTAMGLSLDELQQIASEAGIDPQQIIQAAAEIDIEGRTNESTFWGGPFSFNSQVWAESEITDGQWEEMLISIREFFQSKGEVTSRESVFEWSSPWGTTNSAHVTALKDNGKTKISVSWHGPFTAIPFYIPVPLVAIASVLFASGFLELTAIPGLAFALLATGLTFLTGRWALRKHLDKGFRKLRRMVAALNLITSEKDRNAEAVPGSIKARQTQTDTKNPISQIEIKEANNNDINDSVKAQRYRSQT